MFNDLSNLLIPLASLSNISIVISFNSSFKSFLITFAPVSIAISSNNANLYSPVSGAFTAIISNIPLTLFNTIVDNASPSMSSQIISNFEFDCLGKEKTALYVIVLALFVLL